MESARHVFRVLFLLVIVVAFFIVGRTLLVPKSYGAYGPYRFDNVPQQAGARLPLHGGVASCRECHADRVKTVADGAHRRVSCENCHAPLGTHAKPSGRIAEMAVDRSYTLCARCHRKIDGRPEAFPQIVLAQHQGGVEGKACIECHDPHSPKL
jgi:hypothetical protein